MRLASRLRSTRVYAGVFLHFCIVMLGPAFFVWSGGLRETPDANIGAGMGYLWTISFGLPWSWPLLNDEIVVHGQAVDMLLAICCALVNVGIHAYLVWRLNQPPTDARSIGRG